MFSFALVFLFSQTSEEKRRARNEFVDFLNELRAKRDEGVDSPGSPRPASVQPTPSASAPPADSASLPPPVEAAIPASDARPSADAGGSDEGGRVDA